MKVAIVGTSHAMTENEERDVRKEIELILKDFNPFKTTIISGGAKGVDSIAQAIGLINHFAIKPILPMGFGTKANLARNVEIAEECDKLFCISIPVHDKKCYHHDPPQDHEKTAGCYTLKICKELKKPTQLIVV